MVLLYLKQMLTYYNTMLIAFYFYVNFPWTQVVIQSKIVLFSMVCTCEICTSYFTLWNKTFYEMKNFITVVVLSITACSAPDLYCRNLSANFPINIHETRRILFQQNYKIDILCITNCISDPYFQTFLSGFYM